MKNILLPTDFSENSWNAIKYAIELFKNDTCTFHLLNVYTPIVYDMEYVLVHPSQLGLGDIFRNASQEGLSKWRTKILEQFGNNPNHKFELLARFNTLISGIKEAIEERHIELIVMGTKGATGAKEILFGSNTVHVFKEIKCPILAIPSNFEFDAPHEIMFPTDLKVDYHGSHLNLLQELASAHDSRVNAVHVSSGYELSNDQQDIKLQLESIFHSNTFLFHDVKNMEIIPAINDFQVKHKINLLVMINNKHSVFENLFFKNTVNQIGLHLNIPFLVIPTIKTIE